MTGGWLPLGEPPSWRLRTFDAGSLPATGCCRAADDRWPSPRALAASAPSRRACRGCGALTRPDPGPARPPRAFYGPCRALGAPAGFRGLVGLPASARAFCRPPLACPGNRTTPTGIRPPLAAPGRQPPRPSGLGPGRPAEARRREPPVPRSSRGPSPRAPWPVSAGPRGRPAPGGGHPDRSPRPRRSPPRRVCRPSCGSPGGRGTPCPRPIRRRS